MNSLYQEHLLDHYRNSPYRGTVADADFVGDDHNPSCGDRVSLSGIITSDGIVATVRFIAHGCVLSQAAVSLLIELVQGKSVHEVLSYTSETMVSLVGIRLGPTRLKCALLCLQVLQDGVRGHLQHNQHQNKVVKD